MEKKSRVFYFIGKVVIYTILAILVFIFRTFCVENLKFIIAFLMLLYAVEEVVFEIIFGHRHILHSDKFYLAIIEIILGVVLLVSNVTYDSVCIIWATWSILREAYEIKEIIVEMKVVIPKVLSGVESLTTIVFSVLLILEPDEHHAKIHIYLLLAELVLAGLVPLLDELLVKKEKAAVNNQ